MGTTRLSEEDVQQCFDLFDTDGSQKISRSELTFALRSVGVTNPTEADIDQFMGSVDSDHDGSISRQEFVANVMKRQQESGSEEEIEAVFKLFDSDSTNKITHENLRQISELVDGRPASDKFIKDLIKWADLDGDGMLCFDEFRIAVTKHSEKASRSRGRRGM
eukprot:TRINITY_DN7510_c0_g2_i3.p2 TRINITY_DN7510_c0_g2~~TRINITY_DN7510_c0_g2_i3.p2  ORF type:complete len:163 (+),score=39.12 TRINITY_DN7510_c0_g2_i3:114-602(+)